MNSIPANCPKWLSQKMFEMGGIISFYDFMNIVLNDPQNGYYGSGKAKIGKDGDFVTSPSLSDDFASILSIQIEDWIIQMKKNLESSKKLTILEFGSGNGSLLEGIIDYFLNKDSQILKNINFKIIESNIGMIKVQKTKLKRFVNRGIDIQWINLNDMNDNCLNGIVIAHEVLDAFSVERIQYKNGTIFRQGVELNCKNETLHFKNMHLTEKIRTYIDEIKNEFGINIPPKDVNEEWTTEINFENKIWLKNISRKIDTGILLIIDYAIDSKKYYSEIKKEGTILSYKNQIASRDILNNPGDADLTCHICSDILMHEAKLAGFESVGFVKQGEALLLLGLAKRLFEIQENYKSDLSQALMKREAMLRLIDPYLLGDFKWFVFTKFAKKEFSINTKCIN